MYENCRGTQQGAKQLNELLKTPTRREELMLCSKYHNEAWQWRYALECWGSIETKYTCERYIVSSWMQEAGLQENSRKIQEEVACMLPSCRWKHTSKHVCAAVHHSTKLKNEPCISLLQILCAGHIYKMSGSIVKQMMEALALLAAHWSNWW